MPAEKKLYSPGEAVEYLNQKLQPERPLDLARLARLRREGRIEGERLGERSTVYTREMLENVTLEDIQDKRKSSSHSS